MLSKTVIIFVTVCLLILSGSCRKDFEYANSNGNLSFSKDTVFLDTVFSSIGSSTYTLKVYNRTKEDFVIPSISLNNGNSSNYRLNVDGSAGKSFTDVPLNGQDSLFIFVETTVDFQSNSEASLLYTDVINFDSGDNQQNVTLVTLVQDATFLYPATNPDGSKETIVFSTDIEGNELNVQGFVLNDDELNFTKEKPYVIYGYGVVPEGKELVINSGARVHFHQDSGILIQSGGKLTVNGALSEDQELLEGEVIFEGDRLEPAFSDTPGQWGAIWLAKGSQASNIEYLTIKNGAIGLFVEGDGILDSPTLTIKNSQIYNNSSYNLLSKTSFIEAQNLVLGGAGISSLYCQLGGNYSFIHSTIANYWNKSFRNTSALVLSNYDPMDKDAPNDLLRADFQNCIIDGNNPLELLLLSNGQNTFNYNFMNCILKFDDTRDQFTTDALYDFSSTSNYNGLVLNGAPDFFFPIENNFRIGLDSEALNMGDINISTLVPLDVLGIDRTANPDLGAYQAIPID